MAAPFKFPNGLLHICRLIRCLVYGIVHCVANNLLVNCSPLSLRTCVDIVYGVIHDSENRFSTWVMFVLPTIMALDRFIYRSFLTVTYWLLFVRGEGTRMTIATSLSSSLPENSCIFSFSFFPSQLRAHAGQLLKVSYKMFAMNGQMNSLRVKWYICRWQGWPADTGSWDWWSSRFPSTVDTVSWTAPPIDVFRTTGPFSTTIHLAFSFSTCSEACLQKRSTPCSFRSLPRFSAHSVSSWISSFWSSISSPASLTVYKLEWGFSSDVRSCFHYCNWHLNFNLVCVRSVAWQVWQYIIRRMHDSGTTYKLWIQFPICGDASEQTCRMCLLD